jgi:hypothetical protein
MDVREYLTLLRIQSDHLCSLSVQPATQMEQVEQALTAHGKTPYADASRLVDGVVDLSIVTANMAESFHKRMRAFRASQEETKRARGGS